MTLQTLTIRQDQTPTITDPLQPWHEAVDRFVIEGILLTEQQLRK